MLDYICTCENLDDYELPQFFKGWPNPPSEEMHKKLLKKSTYVWLAIDPAAKRVVGFINALSDETLTAYIPLLEVAEDYQGQGIGKLLVEKMFETLRGHYMIDIVCDDALVPFYEKLDMNKTCGMVVRHYENQSGIAGDQFL